MPTCWGYIRASKQEQETTLTTQAEMIEREYQHRFKGAYARGQNFVDRGVSGSKRFRTRPQGLKLCLAIEPGDLLVITKLDRGFRNLRDLSTMMEEWRDKKIRVVLMDISADTGTPVGLMLVSILGAVAEFERNRISERIRNTFESYRNQGKPTHGDKKLRYGFRIIGEKPNRKMVRCDYSRAVGSKIVAWVDLGWSVARIAHHLAVQGVKTRRGQDINHHYVYYYNIKERALRQEEAEKAARLRAVSEVKAEGGDLAAMEQAAAEAVAEHRQEMEAAPKPVPKVAKQKRGRTFEERQEYYRAQEERARVEKEARKFTRDLVKDQRADKEKGKS